MPHSRGKVGVLYPDLKLVVHKRLHRRPHKLSRRNTKVCLPPRLTGALVQIRINHGWYKPNQTEPIFFYGLKLN